MKVIFLVAKVLLLTMPTVLNFTFTAQFMFVCFFIECECDTEIRKLKLEVEQIKKEVSALKAKPSAYETSDMDELDSLFSSLEGSCSSSFMPTPAAGHALISPPPLPPKDFLFHPRPVPPTITYELTPQECGR